MDNELEKYAGRTWEDDDGIGHYPLERYFKHLFDKRVRSRLYRAAMVSVLAKERSFNQQLDELAQQAGLREVIRVRHPCDGGST